MLSFLICPYFNTQFHPNDFDCSSHSSWIHTTANSMQVSIMQSFNCNRKQPGHTEGSAVSRGRILFQSCSLDCPTKRMNLEALKGTELAQMVCFVVGKLTSVTRLGNLLDLRQLFKAFGNNYFVQFTHILRPNFVKVLKSVSFLVKSFLGNFYRHLAIFSGHTATD